MYLFQNIFFMHLTPFKHKTKSNPSSLSSYLTRVKIIKQKLECKNNKSDVSRSQEKNQVRKEAVFGDETAIGWGNAQKMAAGLDEEMFHL